MCEFKDQDKMIELSRRETEQVQGGLLLYAIQKVRDSAARSADDVYVDGNIITAENYDSAY